ncbi:hypothetical protein [Streptomyces sp. NPDC050534]|uniref:hypothetical protein n=1 Tax=Streptomyces sp. NPDC050534 TaxID=3365625 RepID=UPI00379556BC
MNHIADAASWQARVDLAWRLANGLAGGMLRPGTLLGVRLGVVGPVAFRDCDPPSVPWHDTVSALVRERFGAQVPIDNNTRLATMTETIWGAAAGEPNVLRGRRARSISVVRTS